jgi:hypothetical protein
MPGAVTGEIVSRIDIRRREMTLQPLPTSRRHWLWISVRGLMILVLIVGAWLGWTVRAARVQREALAAIEETGGRVEHDWEWQDSSEWSSASNTKSAKPWGPEWLVDRLGVDYFGSIVSVTLGEQGSDAEMFHIGHLRRLKLLDLGGVPLTDSGLVHIERLADLQDLYLGGTEVSDAGLAHLNGLSKLSQLQLSGTRISDAGMVHLERLTNLQVLFVDDTQVGDVGLARLCKLSRLWALWLSGTQVSDAGVQRLVEAVTVPNIVR